MSDDLEEQKKKIASVAQAFTEVCEVLLPLPDEARRRVVKAARIILRIDNEGGFDIEGETNENDRRDNRSRRA